MFILDDESADERIVTSASDLTRASACEFDFVRAIDPKLDAAFGGGRMLGVAPVEAQVDDTLERAARLGDAHERRLLDDYRQRYDVVDVGTPKTLTSETLRDSAARTLDAFRSGADVVYQATFFDGSFLGYADFIVRERDDARYRVQDTKLARRAKVTALLQLAAYAEQLDALGVERSPMVDLILGTGEVASFAVDDILPVYRRRRARLLQIVAERLAADDPAVWADGRYSYCGHCDACTAEIAARRDVLLVAGLRVLQRERLAASGITTIDRLAGLELRDAEFWTDPDAPGDAVAGMSRSTLVTLSAQAALQVQTERAADGSAHPKPLVDVFRPEAIGVIPEPDAGDVFFDFEGDPLYTEGDGTHWGLDYLFGLVENDGTFRSWWAHDFAEERTALLEFLAYIAERRRAFPNMHIHHYASYERTHLLSIAARHGVGEDAVDQLLRDHVLVDLYPIVKRSIRVGSPSYSIKALEPLYMEGDRDAYEVQKADASITEYAAARALIDNGDRAGGQAKLDAIEEYNAYDCRSTLALRDWLLALAAERGVSAGSVEQQPDARIDLEPSPLADALLARAGDHLGDRTADEVAAAMAAAAIDYHRRENKSFWWGHHARLSDPLDDWSDTRDVLVVDPATTRVEKDWYREGRQQYSRRELRLRGTLAPGSRITAGAQAGPYLVYDDPVLYPNARTDAGARSAKQVRVLGVGDDGSLLVEEVLSAGQPEHRQTPLALTPSPPPQPAQQVPAIEGWAQAIVDGGAQWPADPLVDILRRIPPRTRRGELTPVVGDGYETAVVASLLDLERSYLAVQGPPGTGKTYLASHVITRLVRDHHWKIGVVAQSHAVIENLLRRVVKTGLDAGLVAKALKVDAVALVDPDATAEPAGFHVLDNRNDLLLFAAEHSATGFVIGGTAWDFANAARVPRHSLDLLVVDEAGQFSLASTIAASVAARNVLLLGDPQQLPQVSQGTHPEPIDGSALGWVAAGHDVLPDELGYFLASSYRIHPALAEPVSILSYEGQLRSHPDAADRSLEGVEPGLHAVPLEHAGNATESPEEAAEVVAIAQRMLGLPWSPESGESAHPLRPDEIIVVTPYNAQLARIREALDAAGLPGVRVGTVDKFQGQEAVIAIVSLAASSAADVPRGMEFLIMKNRLNVAISRAQWAAFLVYSPALLDYLPHTPAGVAELSAFIRLVETPLG